jgi:hypothetical protein
MNEFKKAIQAKAKDLQIALGGFAARDRFGGLDPQHDPFSIFRKDIRSSWSADDPRGTLRGVEDGTDVNSYSNFGYSW